MARCAPAPLPPSSRFVVDGNGQVRRADIAHVAGATREHRLLDDALLQTLAQRAGRPGRNWKGCTVGGSVEATYVWGLPAAPQ
jgi:hypothetical protein